MPDGPYPANWKQISAHIRARAGDRCECTGQCGLHRGDRCVERHGAKGLFASGDICLTVAHLNHYPPDCRDENLLALCNTCHLRYDGVLHMEHAWRTRRDRKALGDLFAKVETTHGDPAGSVAGGYLRPRLDVERRFSNRGLALDELEHLGGDRNPKVQEDQDREDPEDAAK